MRDKLFHNWGWRLIIFVHLLRHGELVETVLAFHHFFFENSGSTHGKSPAFLFSLGGEVHDHFSFSEALRSGTVQIEKSEETLCLDIRASQACTISLQFVPAQMELYWQSAFPGTIKCNRGFFIGQYKVESAEAQQFRTHREWLHAITSCRFAGLLFCRKV